MKKTINKINFEKFLLIFILIQPIIDLITSLSVRFFQNFATIGVLIKGMFLLFLIVYIFFKYKFKDRKLSTLFIIVFFLYELFYIIINVVFKSNIVFFMELKSSIKAFFAPVVITLLYDIFKNEKIVVKSRYIAYVMLEYVLLILISNFTGTAFNTYEGGKIGSVGWFFSGNDMGTILVSLFPILYYYSLKNFKKFYIILMFISCYCVFQIGTKVSLLGIIIFVILMSILSFINYFGNKNKIRLKNNVIVLALLICFLIVLLPNSPMMKNIKYQYDYTNSNVQIDDESLMDEMIFSGREKFKKETLTRYNKANMFVKIFGLGTFDKNGVEYKLIERDHYDLFFNYGIIGTLLYLFPYIFMATLLIRYILKNKLRKELTPKIETYVIAILLLFGISFMSGHVLLNPTVSFYLSLIICNFYQEIYKISNKPLKLDSKKVTIMALHLKPGGIEKFISLTAKFLSKKYNVEIVSVYKYPEDKIVKTDKKVKIKYLLKDNEIPNKEQIRKCLKDKKILLFFKELIKAIRILILKNIKMKKYISNCDSNIVISTRREHNIILSEYVKDNKIKIATEHNYHTPRYSKKICDSCYNIDYFVVSTLDQKEYYQKLFNGTSLKVIRIPFSIEKTNDEVSKLNNYNLISVGRLSPEKGYLDMIDIMNKLTIKNKKFHLDLIGDGIERDAIEKKIKELKLEKHITLHGRRNFDYIQKKLLNSSLFLMTSYTESFGIVLIEAMSCGVPCILFDDAKGACEIVQNEYNGFIAKNRNFDEYVSKILDAFESKKIKNMGKNSKEISKQFDVKIVENQWLDLLEEKIK